MATFQITEFINRPPDETFDFATDLDRVSLWIPDVVRIEKLTPGRFAPGTKFIETRRISGREHATEIEVTEHERPVVHAATAVCFGCLANYRYIFKPEGNGTRIDLIAEVTGKGLAMFVAPMLLAMMKKQDSGQLSRLKAAIESHQAEPE